MLNYQQKWKSRSRSGFFVSENRHRVATVTAIVRPSLNQSRSASSRALLESVSGAAPFAVDNGQQHPPIFARTADFAAESLFGSQTERARAALEAIIYAKTNDYSRLVEGAKPRFSG
jgi:hypothetical protein